MAGLVVFKSLSDAVLAGFEICGNSAAGYLVRTRTPAGWALAIVERHAP